MLLPFSLIITGCGGLKKGSIFNEKFMQANFGEKIAKAYEFVAPEKVDVTALEGTYDAGPYYASHKVNGVDHYHKYLMSFKKGTKFGYFSAIENKWVMPFDEYYESGSKVITAEGFHLLFLYNCKYDAEDVRTSYLYDEYGNEIFIGENGVSGDGYSIFAYKQEIQVEEGSDVKTLIKFCKGSVGYNVPVAFAYYTVDAKLKEVITPEEYYKRQPYMAEIDEAIASKGSMSLAEYGHPELRMLYQTNNGQINYRVFNTKKEKWVSSFSVRSTADLIAVDDYIYYQVPKYPHEREDTYTYFDEDSKVNLETYRVNYLNGKEEKVKTNFILSSAVTPIKRVLKDGKGVNSFVYLANSRQIEKDKSLSKVRRSVILDKNFKEVADVNGIDLTNIKPFGEKYWTVKNIVYDSSLKEVGFLALSNDASAPRIAYDGGYGLVDYTGKYIVNPIWDSIQKMEFGEYYYATSAKVVKIFKVENEKAVDVASLDLEMYTPVAPSGKSAYLVVNDIEAGKNILFDMRTGSFSDIPEAGIVDATYNLTEVSAREDTVVFEGALYRTGPTYFLIRSATNITCSYVAAK